MIPLQPLRGVARRSLPATATFVLALALGSACAVRPPSVPPLNSERIAQRFGSFGIEVLFQDHALRISNLYSNEPGGRVCRTFALVSYPASVPRALAREHRLIQSGRSLGAVFKASGWRVEKRHRYLGEIPMEPRFKRLERLMDGVAAPRLAVHVYDFLVAKGGMDFAYATIAEFHHPDYLTLADLRAIYTGGRAGYANADDAISQVLELARQFWVDPARGRSPAHQSLPGG